MILFPQGGFVEIFLVIALALSLLGCVALAVFLIRASKQRQAALRERDALNDQVSTQAAHMQGLRNDLSKYQVIVDAEAVAAGIVQQGHRDAAALVDQGRQDASRFASEAQAARDHAAEVSMRIREQAATEGNQEVLAAQAYAEKVKEDAMNAVRHAQGVRMQEEALLAELRSRAASEGDQIISLARSNADQLTADAMNRLREAQTNRLQEEALIQNIRNEASGERARILSEAREKADEIAGHAFKAIEEAKRLEDTARAMQNVIEGYGNRFVIPTQSLLDELAEKFGFSEIGERLKAARAHTRNLVKERRAAACDYVEANRRDTAIDFVVDAFNGKVDTVLSSAKTDNFGTLETKIRDAFTLVNHEARAFRNARILPHYLESRLAELRWAVAIQELKAQEREEQRALNERIREEEKVQKELERARKDAEKEESILRVAAEKAAKELEHATAEQRDKYEEQLAVLTEQLRAAEEKKRRALSMAQQTKQGNVYIISNIGSFGEDVFKIGMTRRSDPLDRIRELGDASVPFEFDVHAFIKCDDAPALEHALHKRFVTKQVNKVNPRKEFFRVSLNEIRAEVESEGVKDVAWTMAAECRSYRETKAMEAQMAAGTLNAKEWAGRQLRAEEAIEREEEAALA